MANGITTRDRHGRRNWSTMTRFHFLGGFLVVLVTLFQIMPTALVAHADTPVLPVSMTESSPSDPIESVPAEPEEPTTTDEPSTTETEDPEIITEPEDPDVAIQSVEPDSVTGSPTEDSAQPETPQAPPQIAKMALSLSTSPVSTGTYVIYSAQAGSQVIDVPGASMGSGVALQLFQVNGTDAQNFLVTCAMDGWCSIKNTNSGLVMDVKEGSSTDTTVVWQHVSNSTNAQKWRFIKNIDGSFTIESALKPGLVLDAKNGQSANGTPLQVYTSNGTNAQNFRLVSTSVSAPSQKVLNDGVYVFSSTLGGNLVVDVPGASKSKGLGLQIYTANQTAAQSFQVNWVSDSYQIIPLVSSQQLVPSRGGNAPSTPVVQDSSVSGDSQLWKITKNTDSTYTIASKANGLVWDVRGAQAQSGTPLQVYTPNGTPAQKFTVSLTSTPVLTNGSWYTLSTPKGNVIDISGDGAANGTQITLYSPNGTNAQKWKAITQSDNTTALVGGSFDKAMDVNGAGTSDGTAIQLFDPNGTRAQSWTLVATGDGWYSLRTGMGTFVSYSTDAIGQPLRTVQSISAAGQFSPSPTTPVTQRSSQTAIVAKIKQIAWPDRTHSINDPKPEYTAALAAVGLSTYNDKYAKIGASCDAFVATVMRSTALDTKYQCCGAQNQMNYLRAHPEKYLRVTNLLNTSNLLPGDIFVSSQHTLIYIGNGQEASASYGDRTASYGYPISFKDSKGTPYEIYRFIG